MSGPPQWWRDLQARIGAQLAEPLDSSEGRFVCRGEGYPQDLLRELAARGGPPVGERLALYHRQIWARLFHAAQQGARRASFALGYFAFNQVASEHLSEHPPDPHDLDRVADGLLLALADELPEDTPDRPLCELSREGSLLSAIAPAQRVSARLVAQAARVDIAERRCSRAPLLPPLRLERSQIPVLLGARLLPAPSLAVVRQGWPLIEAPNPGDPPLVRLAEEEVWAWARAPRGTSCRRIDSTCASLLREASARPLGEAIEAVAKDPAARQILAARLPHYLSLGISCGWWVGICHEQGPSTTR